MAKSDDIKEINRQFCSSNLFCQFNGAIPVTTRDNWGYDHTRLDLEFKHIGGKGRKFHISIFDPKNSAQDRVTQSAIFFPLCESLDTDFNLVRPCHGWIDFVQELADDTIGKDLQPLGLLAKEKGKKVFIKLTINEKGFFKFGTGRCVSKDPDMAYSEEDMRFLSAQEEPQAELDDDTNFMR